MDPQDSIDALLAQYFDQGEPQNPAAIYRGGQREGFVPKEKGTFLPREFYPDFEWRPPPPDTAGDSAENYNPTLVPKSQRIPDLPPDYQLERRPYTGKEVTDEEFMQQELEREKNDPVYKQQQVEQRKKELQAVMDATEADQRRQFYQGPDPQPDMSDFMEWQGEPDSPDLPSQEDIDMARNQAGDTGLQSFVDRFGWEALRKIPTLNYGPTTKGPGLPEEGAPMPRPRQPNVAPGGMRDERIPPLGTMRPQDFEKEQRMMEEDAEDLGIDQDEAQKVIRKRLEELMRQQAPAKKGKRR